MENNYINYLHSSSSHETSPYENGVETSFHHYSASGCYPLPVLSQDKGGGLRWVADNQRKI